MLNRYMQTFIRKKPCFIALCFSLLVVTACQTEDTDKEPVTKKPKVEKITVANDFVVEHLYSPSENEKGSWVAMTFDDKGRMIVSDQYGALYRLELPEIGSDTLTSAPQQLVFPEDQWENDSTQTQLGMGYAQGLLWAFNSLYVVVNHNGGSNMEKSKIGRAHV